MRGGGGGWGRELEVSLVGDEPELVVVESGGCNEGVHASCRQKRDEESGGWRCVCLRVWGSGGRGKVGWSVMVCIVKFNEDSIDIWVLFH